MRVVLGEICAWKITHELCDIARRECEAMPRAVG
jgi:hypothetical protein